MTYFLCTAFAAILMYAPGVNYWNRTWLFPWAELLFATVIGFCVRLRPLSMGLLAGYALCRGVTHFAVASGYYNLSMVENSTYTFVALLAAFGFAHLMGRHLPRWMFGLSFIVMTFGIIAYALMGKHVTQRGIFIGNPSMTGCLIACILPMLLTRSYDAFDIFFSWGLILLTVVALYLLDSTVPFLVLGTVLTALVFHKYKQARWWIVGGVATTVLTFVCLGLENLRGIEFFNDSNRFKIWAIGWRQIWNAPLVTQLFGFGLGTTQKMLPLWQGSANDIWTWYHNDFLQAFVELGFVGASLIAYALYDLVRLAWRQTGPNFAILCGMFVWGLFNYPTHMAIPALFCAHMVLSITHCRFIKA